MMNRRLKVTLPQMLMLGVQHLTVCCPLAVTPYLLAPLVSSVNITQSPFHFIFDKYFMHKVYTTLSRGVPPFSARMLPASDTRYRGLLALHHRPTQRARWLAMRLLLLTITSQHGILNGGARIHHSLLVAQVCHNFVTPIHNHCCVNHSSVLMPIDSETRG